MILDSIRLWFIKTIDNIREICMMKKIIKIIKKDYTIMMNEDKKWKKEDWISSNKIKWTKLEVGKGLVRIEFFCNWKFTCKLK